MLSLAAAAVLAADDGHDHGQSGSGDSCSTYEWGAIFAMPTTNSEIYTWTAYKTGTPLAFAEANMKVVFLPVADAAEATLTTAIAEAVDGMGHTPCTDVEPGETIPHTTRVCAHRHSDFYTPTEHHHLHPRSALRTPRPLPGQARPSCPASTSAPYCTSRATTSTWCPTPSPRRS